MFRCMRTTLTLDDDVAVRLRRLKEEHDLAFKDVVNTALRRGLEVLEGPALERGTYSIRAVDLGAPRVPLDSIADALEVADGDGWR